jgi:hypothetical protein
MHLAAAVIRSSVRRAVVRQTAAIILQRWWRQTHAIRGVRRRLNAKRLVTVRRVLLLFMMRRRLQRLMTGRQHSVALRQMHEAQRTVAMAWKLSYCRRRAGRLATEAMSIREAAAIQIQRGIRTALARRRVARYRQRRQDELIERRRNEAALIIQRRFFRNVVAHRDRRHRRRNSRLVMTQERAALVIQAAVTRFATKTRAARRRRERAEDVQRQEAARRLAYYWRRAVRSRKRRAGRNTEVAAVRIQRRYRAHLASREMRKAIAAHRGQLASRRQGEAATAIARAWRRRRQAMEEREKHREADDAALAEAHQRHETRTSRSRTSSAAVSSRLHPAVPPAAAAMVMMTPADTDLLVMVMEAQPNRPVFVEDDAELIFGVTAAPRGDHRAAFHEGPTLTQSRLHTDNDLPVLSAHPAARRDDAHAGGVDDADMIFGEPLRDTAIVLPSISSNRNAASPPSHRRAADMDDGALVQAMATPGDASAGPPQRIQAAPPTDFFAAFFSEPPVIAPPSHRAPPPPREQEKATAAVPPESRSREDDSPEAAAARRLAMQLSRGGGSALKDGIQYGPRLRAGSAGATAAEHHRDAAMMSYSTTAARRVEVPKLALHVAAGTAAAPLLGVGSARQAIESARRRRASPPMMAEDAAAAAAVSTESVEVYAPPKRAVASAAGVKPREPSPPAQAPHGPPAQRPLLRSPPAHVAAQMDSWAAEAQRLLQKSAKFVAPSRAQLAESVLVSPPRRSAQSHPITSGGSTPAGRLPGALSGGFADAAAALRHKLQSPALIHPDFASPVHVPGLELEPPSSPRPVHQRDLVRAASATVAASASRLHPHSRRRQVDWLDSYLRTASLSPRRDDRYQ